MDHYEEAVPRSERLTYRKLSEADYQIFHDLYTNEQVMRYAYLNRLQSEEKARKAFLDTLQHQRQELVGEYVAILSETGEKIAIVDYEVLIRNDHGGICEIGYFIKPEYWGMGYGAEMGKALLDYLFREQITHKVVASCNGNNRASENIMKKLGMQREGVFRMTRYKDGRWDDEIKYAILKSDWEKGKR